MSDRKHLVDWLAIIIVAWPFVLAGTLDDRGKLPKWMSQTNLGSVIIVGATALWMIFLGATAAAIFHVYVIRPRFFPE